MNDCTTPRYTWIEAHDFVVGQDLQEITVHAIFIDALYRYSQAPNGEPGNASIIPFFRGLIDVVPALISGHFDPQVKCALLLFNAGSKLLGQRFFKIRVRGARVKAIPLFDTGVVRDEVRAALRAIRVDVAEEAEFEDGFFSNLVTCLTVVVLGQQRGTFRACRNFLFDFPGPVRNLPTSESSIHTL